MAITPMKMTNIMITQFITFFNRSLLLCSPYNVSISFLALESDAFTGAGSLIAERSACGGGVWGIYFGLIVFFNYFISYKCRFLFFPVIGIPNNIPRSVVLMRKS